MNEKKRKRKANKKKKKKEGKEKKKKKEGTEKKRNVKKKKRKEKGRKRKGKKGEKERKNEKGRNRKMIYILFLLSFLKYSCFFSFVSTPSLLPPKKAKKKIDPHLIKNKITFMRTD